MHAQRSDKARFPGAAPHAHLDVSSKSQLLPQLNSSRNTLWVLETCAQKTPLWVWTICINRPIFIQHTRNFCRFEWGWWSPSDVSTSHPIKFTFCWTFWPQKWEIHSTCPFVPQNVILKSELKHEGCEDKTQVKRPTICISGGWKTCDSNFGRSPYSSWI